VNDAHLLLSACSGRKAAALTDIMVLARATMPSKCCVVIVVDVCQCECVA